MCLMTTRLMVHLFPRTTFNNRTSVLTRRSGALTELGHNALYKRFISYCTSTLGGVARATGVNGLEMDEIGIRGVGDDKCWVLASADPDLSKLTVKIFVHLLTASLRSGTNGIPIDE